MILYKDQFKKSQDFSDCILFSFQMKMASSQIMEENHSYSLDYPH